MDYNQPGSSDGILQARILEWVASGSPPGDLPDPGIRLHVLRLLHCRRILPAEPPGKHMHIDTCCAVLGGSVVSDPLQPHGL